MIKSFLVLTVGLCKNPQVINKTVKGAQQSNEGKAYTQLEIFHIISMFSVNKKLVNGYAQSDIFIFHSIGEMILRNFDRSLN